MSFTVIFPIYACEKFRKQKWGKEFVGITTLTKILFAFRYLDYV